MKRVTNILACAVVAIVSIAGAATIALADYPDRAVKMIVGSVPGSGPDVLARSMSEELAAALGQPVVVENKPGAAGNVAAAAVSRGDPDGYEIFIGTINMAIATWLPKEPPFDPATDFAIVGRVASIPDVVVISPDLGPKTIEDYIELARSKPGELNYSSPGVGSLQHMGTDSMASMNGIEMVHVPYKGGKAATTAVLAREVDMFMAGMPPAIPHIKTGALLALAVSSAQRFALLPDVPTLTETVMPGYSAEAWYGLFMAKGTPDDIVAIVNAAANRALADPNVIERFANAGAAVETGTPGEFAEFVATESARWKKNLEELGLAGTR
ncbi:MAG: tripartite tricarboxylate transporter substrate-binding protein [Paracoccaceae bacterium]|nr:tripartite tricarboxylate transporter substrate-binding protein [Paracoccaceae bacterium]